MAPNKEVTSSSGSSGSKRTPKPKEAIRNHETVMQSSRQLVEHLGIDRSTSLGLAAGLRQQDMPVYHSRLYKEINGSREAGLKGYDNTLYHDSVQAVRGHGAALTTAHSEVDRHIKGLNSHKKQAEVKHLLVEAHQMKATLRKVRPWVDDHIEDKDALHDIHALHMNGRKIDALVQPRPTHDIVAKMDQVIKVLDGMPKQNPTAKALEDHQRQQQEISELVHQAADKKLAVVQHDVKLRNKGLPIVDSNGFAVVDTYHNADYYHAVQDITAHGKKMSRVIDKAQGHAEALKSLNNKTSKEAKASFTALMSAHEMMQTPHQDPNALIKVNNLLIPSKRPTIKEPQSKKQLAEHQKYLKNQIENIEAIRSLAPKIASSSKGSKGKNVV
jgi:hypothetical protein